MLRLSKVILRHAVANALLQIVRLPLVTLHEFLPILPRFLGGERVGSVIVDEKFLDVGIEVILLFSQELMETANIGLAVAVFVRENEIDPYDYQGYYRRDFSILAFGRTAYSEVDRDCIDNSDHRNPSDCLMR